MTGRKQLKDRGRKDVNRQSFYSENIKLHKGVEVMLKKRKLAAWGL